MIRLHSLVPIAALLCAASGVDAADLQVGQAAPDFTLPDQAGVQHRLADERGKTVVLAFYPKDFTGG